MGMRDRFIFRSYRAPRHNKNIVVSSQPSIFISTFPKPLGMLLSSPVSVHS